MANKKFFTMLLGLADRANLKRIAALMALTMTFEAGAVPLAQAAVIGQSIPVRTQSGAELPAPVSTLAKPAVAVSPFRVPASIGATVESYAPAAAGRLIYHLQDVHGHVGAQTNLSEIVSRLSSYAEAQGRPLVIAVEGGAGKIETDSLSSFQDENVKRQVSSALLRSGFLMGEEYAAIVGKPGRVKIVGIESPSLYDANVVARERSAESRERVLGTIREIKSQLMKLEDHNFSNQLLALEQSRVAVEEGRMEMADYVGFLVRTDKALVAKFPMVSLMASLHAQEAAIDFQAVEKEGRRLVETIVRQKNDAEVERIMNDAVALREGRISPLAYYEALLARGNDGYPSLKAYVAYLRNAERVQPDALFLELQSLETEMAGKLVRHPLARELYKDVRWIERQERFFALNMVPQEWQAQKGVDVAQIYRTHGEIRAFVAEQVNALGYRFAVPPFSMSDLQVAVRGASGFYTAAEARDHAMESNLQKVLDKHATDGAIVAFIAGGFHTPGMTHELRAHGVAYQVIRPQLEPGVELNKDLTYPDFKGKVGLISNRANTDYLRPASQLTEAGHTVVNRLFGEASANPAKATGTRTSIRSAVTAIWTPLLPSARSVRLYEGFGFAIGVAVGIILTLAVVVVILSRDAILIGFRALVSTVKKTADEARADEAVRDETTAVPAPAPALPAPDAAPVAPAKPNPDQILAMVKASAQVFGLDPVKDLSDILYIAVQYNNLLNGSSPLTMYTNVTAPLNPASPESGNPSIANFQVSALHPEQTFQLIGVIDLASQVAKRKAGDAPIRVRVMVNALDGGIGENYTRVLYLMNRFLEKTGVIIDPVLGAKGTDLAHPITVVRTQADGSKVKEVREVSVAEMKLLQLLHKKQQFAQVAFEPLVNGDSKGSYERLFNQPFLGDVLDDRVAAKRSYREVLNAAGVELPGLHLQKDLFGVKADDKTLPTTKEGVPAQPGGHAQLGFWFFLEALQEAEKGEKKELPTVRVFYNGDNLNSRPNEDLVQHMLNNDHVAYMVATPAEMIDKKGGKIGIRWQLVDGEYIPVPDMMEMAQAKTAKQLDPFYDAGQEGGLGVPGKQLFNTNQLYINQDLLGGILKDLKDLLRKRLGTDDDTRLNFELAKIFGPTLIEKPAKNGYYPIDGAIGSVLLNLNAYFLLNKRDAEVADILARRNIDRILRIVDGPRMEAFTPEKTPADRINEDGRFTVDSAKDDFNANEWTFVDSRPGQPMPDIEVFGKVDGQSTANWKNDAIHWADLGTIQSLLPKLNTSDAKYLGFYGLPVQFPIGTTFAGSVKVTNYMKLGQDGSRRTDLRPYAEKLAELDPTRVQVSPSESADGFSLSLKDVHLVIRADGSIEALPFGQEPVKQPFSRLGAVIAGLVFVALGGFGIAVHPYVGFVSLLGLPFFALAATAKAVVNEKATVPAGTTLAGIESDPRFDAAAIAAVKDFADRVKPGSSLEVRLINGSGAEADAKNGILYVGTSLLVKSSGIGAVLRRTLLRAVLRHELVHYRPYLQVSTNSKGVFFALNEAIAFTLGLGAFVLPSFLVLGAAPIAGGKSFATPAIDGAAASYGERTRRFMEGMTKLYKENRDRQTKVGVPSHIGIDVDSLPEFGMAPATGGAALSESDASFISLLAGISLPAAGSEDANGEVALYTTNKDDVARLERLQAIVARANGAIKGVTFRLVVLDAPLVNVSALFGESAVNVTEANTVLLSAQSLTVAGARHEIVLGVPHLALATFAYARYSNGSDVLKNLVDLFVKLMPEFIEQKTLTESVTDQIIAAIQA